MLEAKNISYFIGKKRILHDINISIQPGETIAICGPNGAGKSSLLKLLSGEIKPTSGSVLFEKRDLKYWNIKELATRRAVLHQESLLSFPFLVEEVVQLGRYPYPATENQADLIHRCLEKVDMQDYKKRSYTSLSGGEKQRVHLARVLAQLEEDSIQTKILMLDEPTSALDLSHQEGTLHIASQYAKNNRYGVLVILHDLNLASAWADRIVFLKEGKLHIEGSPKEVITRAILSQIYHIEAHILEHPDTRRPLVVIDRNQL